MSRSDSPHSRAHSVRVEPLSGRAQVHWRGHVLADSQRALLLRETGLEPVVYFPREDVQMPLLERTEHSSVCPYKGQACYWSIRAEESLSENSVWSYEDPIPEVAEIRDHLAFWLARDPELKLSHPEL